jgi:stearoyl-CoA desaturase (delta-9 desaturase)
MQNSEMTTQPPLTRPPSFIHWVNAMFLSSTALVALVGLPLHIYYFGTSWSLIGVFVFFLVATGLSITGGYHRLFAHRSYEAKSMVKLFYLIFGAAACENSVLSWATDHRNHHRFVDRDGDPYNIQRGFFHAHMGWVFFKEPVFFEKPEDSSVDVARDLKEDPLVCWQDKYYLPIAIIVGGGLPLLIGYFLGNAVGCFLLAGVARTVIVHHSTFLINSLCHFIGKQPYSLKDSSRDSTIAAILTCGEGYHNYHHRFQYDYRNGVRWFQFDPTKWLIKTLETLRLAKGLRTASDLHIFRARLDIQRAQAEQRLAGLSHEFHERMKRKIHNTYEALLTAYGSWQELKQEYRSIKRTLGHKRKELTLKLKRDLQRASSNYMLTRASWALVSTRNPFLEGPVS